jgi:hypothetical protein
MVWIQLAQYRFQWQDGVDVVKVQSFNICKLVQLYIHF